jgi:shikimate kinase
MPTFRTSQPVSAADPSRPHVVLVGLPGSGKSTVGALLATALGRSFLDFDAELSRRHGMTVAELFGQHGEGHFRDLELGLTEELRELGNMILAPGGGWVSRPDTVARLRPPATLVYLKLSPAAAILRMGAGVGGRPLLSHPNPRGELERLLGARKPVYESADLVIDVERIDPQEVTKRIIDRLGAAPRSAGPNSPLGG